MDGKILQEKNSPPEKTLKNSQANLAIKKIILIVKHEDH